MNEGKTTMAPITVALAQLRSVVGDSAGNLRRAAAAIRDAAGRGARLVLLPELFLPGYAAEEKFAALAEPVPGPSTRALANLAGSLKVEVVVGLARRDVAYPHGVYNSAVMLGARGVGAVYDKVHLGTFGPFREGCWFAPGREAGVVPTVLGPAGLAICYDCSFPELPRRLARAGAESLLVISAGPVAAREKWGHLLRTRAYENAMWVLYCNAVGEQGPYAFFGGSRIVAPDGEVFAHACDGEEEILVAQIDPEVVARERYRRHPFRVDGPAQA